MSKFHEVDWGLQFADGMVRRSGVHLSDVLKPKEKPIAVYFWHGNVRSPVAPGSLQKEIANKQYGRK
jgi:hypothetical protein